MYLPSHVARWASGITKSTMQEPACAVSLLKRSCLSRFWDEIACACEAWSRYMSFDQHRMYILCEQTDPNFRRDAQTIAVEQPIVVQ